MKKNLILALNLMFSQGVLAAMAATLPVKDIGTPFGNPYIGVDSNTYLNELAASTDPLKNNRGITSVKVNRVTHWIRLPVRFWEVSGLGLYGLANYDKAAKILAADSKKYGAPLRRPLDLGNNTTMIFVYSANLNGSDVGPVKDFFISILLEPTQQEIDIKSVASIYTWLFYHNSKVNNEWKTKFWGIDNKLARIDFSFKEGAKESVLSLPAKNNRFQEAVKMRWNISKMPQKPIEIELSTEVVETFVSQSKRVFNPFYFKGSMLWDANKTTGIQGGPSQGLTLFDPNRDVWEVSDNGIKAKLDRIEFKPSHWIMITDYSGQLNFPDQKVYTR
jgi:hypothetical protein